MEECPDQQKVLKPIPVMRSSGMCARVEVFTRIWFGFMTCPACCACSCVPSFVSVWMEISVPAEQLTTVPLSTFLFCFLQLEPSECQNIWLHFLHPQSPLMCAASSCVSMGRVPIRSRRGTLAFFAPVLKNTGLFDLSDVITLWWEDEKMNRKWGPLWIQEF